MQAPALAADGPDPAGELLVTWAAHQIAGKQTSCVAAWSAWLRCCKRMGAHCCRALSQTVLEALYQQTKEIAQGLEEEDHFPGIDDMEGHILQTAS